MRDREARRLVAGRPRPASGTVSETVTVVLTSPARQDLLFAGAPDVQNVGTQAIGGVATTQSSGSITHPPLSPLSRLACNAGGSRAG